MIRLLLPFTQEVDIHAIHAALMVAQERDATLVAFSLIRSAEIQAARESQIAYRQPSIDFLEAVQQQAVQMGVSVARIELTTHNAGQSIHVFARELNCSGILLFLREGAGVLLDTREVKQILEKGGVPQYLIRLSAPESTSLPGKWHPRWFQRPRKEFEVEFIQVRTYPTTDVPGQRDRDISRQF